MNNKLMCLILLLFLGGCGSINSYVAAQNAMIVKDTKAADDNLVHGIENGICAVPVGAVIRNTEFIPIAESACLPAGTNNSPGVMFQNMIQSKPPVVVPTPIVVTQTPQPVIPVVPRKKYIPYKKLVVPTIVPQVIAPTPVPISIPQTNIQPPSLNLPSSLP